MVDNDPTLLINILAPARRLSLPERVSEFERACIVAALAENDGNRTHTARALGISQRTMFRKMREYGLGDL